MALLNDAHSKVEIYLWSEPDLVFEHAKSFDLTVDGYIESVTPGDFNYDGRLDILLVVNRSDTYFQAEIYLQSDDNTFDSVPEVVFNTTNQPAVLDVNGDMFVDLVFNTWNSAGSEFTVVAEKQPNGYQLKRLSEYAFLSSEICLPPSDRRLSTPHSLAFVDLNKDCWADLFLTTFDPVLNKHYFEIWLNMRSGSFCIVQIEEQPDNSGQVSFADIDRNGVEDLIFPTGDGNINVVFNENDHSNDCKFELEDISYKTFKELNFDTEGNKTNAALTVPLDFGLSFAQENAEIPLILRTGDLDLDGFPDLLVTVDDGNGAFCAVLRNVKRHGKRGFSLETGNEYDKMKEKRGTYLCTFFDLDENGIPDILVSYRNNSVSTTVSLYNNFLDDAFHLKALSLNGYGKQKYSSSYSGPVFMFTITELDMNTVQMHSTQLPQTAYFALQTPYCLYGIGRTNSYIEQFYVNVPSLAHSAKMWTPIIPNSYLIVSPKRSKSSKKVDIEGWFLELFASPTDKIGVVIAGAAFFLIVIGGFVLYRYRKEKEEDRQLVVGFL